MAYQIIVALLSGHTPIWCNIASSWLMISAQDGAEQHLFGVAACRHKRQVSAHNVIEAIMWHAYSKQSDAYFAAEKFYKLKKADRDAVVAFINAI